jgi:hypothetical protein
MTARFLCPHCHSSVNPLAMERACSDLAEYRICPACDEPVFFAVLDAPKIPPWLQRDDRSCAARHADRSGPLLGADRR